VAAISKAPYTRRRIASASEIVFIPGAEVGLPDSAGDDEVVVAELDGVAADPPGQHPSPVDVKVDHLGQDTVGVLLVLEQITQRCGDLALGHDAGRALVEQRLE
jgi:hypothetical protein